jgi:hypothetical protein
MTGTLNSGTNPISRITIASLADLGYSVNNAAADPYVKPVGGSTLIAQPSNGSVRNLIRASDFGPSVNAAPASTPIGTSLPSRPTTTSVQPVRRSALNAASTRFDGKVVDAVLAAAYQRGDVKKSDDVFVRDKSDVADFSLVNADKFFAQLGARFVSSNVKSMPARK